MTLEQQIETLRAVIADQAKTIDALETALERQGFHHDYLVAWHQKRCMDEQRIRLDG